MYNDSINLVIIFELFSSLLLSDVIIVVLYLDIPLISKYSSISPILQSNDAFSLYTLWKDLGIIICNLNWWLLLM